MRTLRATFACTFVPDIDLRLRLAQLKEVDDVVYEADCAMITIKEGEVNIGANACVPSSPHLRWPRQIGLTLLRCVRSSAEEAEEALEEGEQRVNNVVHSFRLTETSFDKKSCVRVRLSLTWRSTDPVQFAGT